MMLPSTRFFAALALGTLTLVALASLFAPVFVSAGPALGPIVEPPLKLLALATALGLGAIVVPLVVRLLLTGAHSLLPRLPVLAGAAGPAGDRLVIAAWAIYLAGLAVASPELAAFVLH